MNHVAISISKQSTTSHGNTKRNICKKKHESLVETGFREISSRENQLSKLKVRRNYIISFLGKSFQSRLGPRKVSFSAVQLCAQHVYMCTTHSITCTCISNTKVQLDKQQDNLNNITKTTFIHNIHEITFPIISFYSFRPLCSLLDILSGSVSKVQHIC